MHTFQIRQMLLLLCCEKETDKDRTGFGDMKVYEHRDKMKQTDESQTWCSGQFSQTAVSECYPFKCNSFDYANI